MEKPTSIGAPPDTVARVQAELEAAMQHDDAVRLKTLDELYRSLEGELDQAGSARR